MRKGRLGTVLVGVTAEVSEEARHSPDEVCLLVMIGVCADGRKELIALVDGHRESTETWADLLPEGKRRGMAPPVLAIGVGHWGSGSPCMMSSRPFASSGAGSQDRASSSGTPTAPPAGESLSPRKSQMASRRSHLLEARR